MDRKPLLSIWMELEKFFITLSITITNIHAALTILAILWELWFPSDWWDSSFLVSCGVCYHISLLQEKCRYMFIILNHLYLERHLTTFVSVQGWCIFVNHSTEFLQIALAQRWMVGRRSKQERRGSKSRAGQSLNVRVDSSCYCVKKSERYSSFSIIILAIWTCYIFRTIVLASSW